MGRIKIITIFSFSLIILLMCSGCITKTVSEKSITISPTELPAVITTQVTPQQIAANPAYSNGDIINDVKLAYKANLVFNYDRGSDSYDLVPIEKYQGNETWGFIKDFDIERKSRTYVEETYIFKVGHVNVDEMLANYGQKMYDIVKEQIDTGIPKYTVGDIVAWQTSSFKDYYIILDYTPQSDKYTVSGIHKQIKGGWAYLAYIMSDGTLNCEYRPVSFHRRYLEIYYKSKVDHALPENIKCETHLELLCI